MTDLVAIELRGQSFGLELDHEDCTWMPFEDRDAEQLEDTSFPLIAVAHGSRYELFSDGTFAEAAL